MVPMPDGRGASHPVTTARRCGHPSSATGWAVAESALGTALASGYEGTVDLFGADSFDGYVDLLVPGALG